MRCWRESQHCGQMCYLLMPVPRRRWIKSVKGPNWTQHEAQNIALRAPSIFCKRVQPMQDLMDWVRSDACTLVETDDEIKHCFWTGPSRFMTNLHGRARPRHDLIKQKGLRVTINHLLSDSDEVFARRLSIDVGVSTVKQLALPPYQTT